MSKVRSWHASRVLVLLRAVALLLLQLVVAESMLQQRRLAAHDMQLLLHRGDAVDQNGMVQFFVRARRRTRLPEGTARRLARGLRGLVGLGGRGRGGSLHLASSRFGLASSCF